MATQKPVERPERFLSIHLKAPASEVRRYRAAAALLFDGNLSMFLRRAARQLADASLPETKPKA